MAWIGIIASSAAVGAISGGAGAALFPLTGGGAVIGGAIIGGVGGGLLNLVKQTAASLICEEYVPSIGELGQSVALGLVSGGIGGGIGGALSRGILGPLGRGPLSAAWNNLGTQESILGISAISGWAADVTLNALTR